jgi:hypothetical protein
MKAVLVLELRGLTQQAEVLVHELEHMSMNTERIRAATIDITKGAITRVSAAQHPEASGQQGTDTFYWTFPDVDSGAIFGSLLIARSVGQGQPAGSLLRQALARAWLVRAPGERFTPTR